MSDVPAVYAKLLEIRKKENLSLKPLPTIREKILLPNGTEVPFQLRPYQVSGIYHMLLMNRFVLGDDTGLGKTLESIVTYACLLHKNPDLKAMVVTNKSVLRQWQREFTKFTIGIGTHVISGTPKERVKQWEAYFASPKHHVVIVSYSILRRDFPQVLKALNDVKMAVFYDECFDYHTPVVLEDGSTELIGKVVCQEMPVRVMSWNPDTQQTEPRKVVRWYRNPKRGKSLLRIGFRYGKSVRVTKSHKFYQPRGTQTAAKNLKVGSKVLSYSDQIPTEAQWQIVLGGLLGDASVSHPHRNLCGVVFVQSEKKRPYFEFKRSVLSSLGISEEGSSLAGYQPKTGAKVPVLRSRLSGNPAISSFIRSSGLHNEEGKCVTAEWLDRVDPLGLAIWYGDDGTIQQYEKKDGSISTQISLHTEGFSKEENVLLAGWLRWKWGVAAQVKTSQTKGKTYYYLYLKNEAATEFLRILPGSLPGVEYKFPGKDPIDLGIQTPSSGLVEDEVTAYEKWVSQDKDEYVYNIEVEGNHNYFAGGALVSNCTAFKNPTSRIHQICREIAVKTERTYGLTATLLRNNLIEGYGIYKVVVPGLFGTKTKFMRDFCVTKEINLPGSRRKIPVIVGYRKKDIGEFKEMIDPYFLGRAKQDVAKDLPKLVTTDIEVPLNVLERQKYREALVDKLLMVGEEAIETNQLTAVTYCQEIVDSLHLVGIEDVEGSKEEALMAFLEAEFKLRKEKSEPKGMAFDKIIIHTRFKKMVDRLQKLLWKKLKIKAARITGDENDAQREKSQEDFQNGDINVIFVTKAGSEAINLQMAKAIIFYDLPWSAGDYIQTLGRMIRIGSPHQSVLCFHMLATAGGQPTIDHRVRDTLELKMGLIEHVLGARMAGTLGAGQVDDDAIIKASSDVKDIFSKLKSDATILRVKPTGKLRAG